MDDGVTQEASGLPAFFTDPAAVLLTLVAFLLLIAAGRIVLRWYRGEPSDDEDLPPLLLFPATPRANGLPRPEEHPSRSVVETNRDGAAPDRAANPAGVTSPHGGGNGAPAPPTSEARLAAGAPAVRTDADASDFEATLQLLPGRLEPVSGEVEREIRFIRVPASTRYTIGRSPGPEHTHIQLDSPTTSRLHACMEFVGGRWRIGNLSRTNCVVVNGSPLEGDASRWLADGDQVEFGGLMFVFRSR